MSMNREPLLTIAAALAEARSRLGPEGELEASLLLSHLLGRPRVYLYTWPERRLTPEEGSAYFALIERRASGEPIAYLTGHREFWSLDLLVSPATLIPRADTETLVAGALARIPRDARRRIADLGTGSGAIALAIAQERPGCEVIATDASAAALAVARTNAQRLGIGNVAFREGAWFEAVAGERFQLIASNPPYIPEHDAHLSTGDLRFEPHSALASGHDGLADLRLLVTEAPRHLAPGGWLLLEHGYDQGEAVRQMMTENGFTTVETIRDLEQRDRITAGAMVEGRG